MDGRMAIHDLGYNFYHPWTELGFQHVTDSHDFAGAIGANQGDGVRSGKFRENGLHQGYDPLR